MYEYRATVIANVDGDTVHTEIDLGFDIYQNHTLRFAGINAPEVSTQAGRDVAAWVATVIPPGTVITIHTAKDRAEKYGRYLAWLILTDGSCLNRTLVDTGRAVPYGNLPVDPPA
jgi:endonuclease YncB( thermonuclease family)